MVQLLRVWFVLAFTVAAPRLIAGEVLELITDRPDFTESAVVVPRGSVQIEAGVTWLREPDGGVDVLSGPEGLLRWGLAPRLELRLGLPDHLSVSGGAGDGGVWTDGTIGIKWQLGPVTDRWDLALIAEVEVPTGGVEATAEVFDPGLVVTSATCLGDRWSLGLQAGISRETLAGPDGEDELWRFGGTLVVGFGVSDQVGTFVEVATEKPEHLATLLFLHHGWTWLVVSTLQLDAHLAVGLTETTPDWLVGVGLSTRW